MGLLRDRGTRVGLLVGGTNFNGLNVFCSVSATSGTNVVHLGYRTLAIVADISLPFVGRRDRVVGAYSVTSFTPGSHVTICYSAGTFIVDFSHTLHRRLGSHGVGILTIYPKPVSARFLPITNVNGNSDNIFSALPHSGPGHITVGSLGTSGGGGAMCTSRFFCGFCHVLTGILPAHLIVGLTTTWYGFGENDGGDFL